MRMVGIPSWTTDLVAAGWGHSVGCVRSSPPVTGYQSRQDGMPGTVKLLGASRPYTSRSMCGEHNIVRP